MEKMRYCGDCGCGHYYEKCPVCHPLPTKQAMVTDHELPSATTKDEVLRRKFLSHFSGQ